MGESYKMGTKLRQIEPRWRPRGRPSEPRAASAKFQEVQSFLSITGHVYTPAYVLVAESQWQRWPEDVRTALEACGSETRDTVYGIAADLETELLDVIKAAGVEVNEADKAAFVAASGPIYEEFASSVDGAAAMIATVQSLADGS